MSKAEDRVRGWRRKVERLLEEVSPVVLSWNGYRYLAKVLLEEGFERAVEVAKGFKRNAPTSTLKTYRSSFVRSVVIRDEYVGFSVPIEASDEIPLNVYPGSIVDLDCINPEDVTLVLSNVDKVFQFVKRNIGFLGSLPHGGADMYGVEYVVLKYLKNGDEGPVKEHASSQFKDGLRSALEEQMVVRLDERFALAPTLSRKYSIVDLKDLRASKLYSTNKVISYVILSARPEVKWRYTVDKFGGIFSDDTIRELAELNPALGLVA